MCAARLSIRIFFPSSARGAVVYTMIVRKMWDINHIVKKKKENLHISYLSELAPIYSKWALIQGRRLLKKEINQYVMCCLTLYSEAKCRCLLHYRKIPNISPGLITFQRLYLGGLFSGGIIIGGGGGGGGWGGDYIWKGVYVKNKYKKTK